MEDGVGVILHSREAVAHKWSVLSNWNNGIVFTLLLTLSRLAIAM
jgi:hypothetical protein